jgi:PAS domain S-box-containing protein
MNPGQEALRASEERYARLFNHVPDGLYETRPDGTVVAANPALVRMLGWESEEALKRNCRAAEFYVRPGLRGEILRRLEEEGAIRNVEIDLYRKDGQVITVLENARVVRDSEGRVVLIQGTMTEITDRKQAMEEVQRARDEALEASRLKTRFLANVSHELRTPLNGVLAMAQVLGESNLPREQQECVTTIEHSAGFLLELINDILDISSIEAGNLRLEEGIFRIRDLLEETAAVVAPRAEASGLAIVTDIDARLPELVRGDGSRLRQVLHNLAVNAVKFTAEGEVVMRAELAAGLEDGVRFEVRDTGIGIPREAQAFIFEPFRQADGSTRRRYGGTGLGLAIARQIVEAMGGRLRVESEEGVGSTFVCEAPLPAAPGCRVTGARRVEGLKGERVLVVEPRPGVRAVMEGWLGRWGVEAAVYGSWGEVESEGRASLVVVDEGSVMEGQAWLPEGAGVVVVGGMRGVGGGIWRVNRPVRELSLLDALLRAGAARRAGPGAAKLERIGVAAGTGVRVETAAKRILAAEDNAVNQMVIRRLVERLGYRIEVVKSGREAVEAVRGGGYAMVLMDCQMPDMDGFEATLAIRKLEGALSGVPVVAVTANALPGFREQCLAAGMDDYLPKPILLDDLARVLGRWVTAGEAAERER